MAKKSTPSTKSKSTKKPPKEKAAAKKHVAAAAQTKKSPETSKEKHKYRSFRLQKSLKTPTAPLPGAFRLMGGALKVLKQHWRLFGGIVAIYALLNLVLVRGFSLGENLDELRGHLGTDAASHPVLASTTLFLYLLGSSGTAAPSNVSAGSYQFVLMFIVSLALIWSFREVYAGHAIRIRDGFYRGMTPLVPFILVSGMVLLQCIPMVIGLSLYTMVASNGVASAVVEQVLWGILAGALSLLSFYLISSSLFALYIVTLPDMTPRRALRAAKDLVRNRRGRVLIKIAFLPLAMLVFSALVVIPLIMIWAPLAVLVFFILSALSIAVVHSYMYALYRSLL